MLDTSKPLWVTLLVYVELYTITIGLGFISASVWLSDRQNWLMFSLLLMVVLCFVFLALTLLKDVRTVIRGIRSGKPRWLWNDK
jgi:hypothetical protein